jgi:long-subunit fatty acid transport protein
VVGRATRPMQWLVCLGVAGCVCTTHAAIISVGLGAFGDVDIEVELAHVGPTGDLITPAAPGATPFRPPAVFSAPLPTGSGARALGFAGAFTAVADDATAASWNPGGLTQLERPEASVVYRYSSEREEHRSSDDSFLVGNDEFSSHNLNYFTVAIPFYSMPLKRNFVFSINYQEAYDFEQRFNANINQATSQRNAAKTADSFTSRSRQHISKNERNIQFLEVDVVVNSHTDVSTEFDQVLGSALLSGLEFEQEGVVSALSPALAVEVTPKVSVGGAFNSYMLDPNSGEKIRSHVRASYEGRTESRVNSVSTRRTTSDYLVTGTFKVRSAVGGGILFGPFPINPPQQSGTFDAFTDVSTSSQRDVLVVEGLYEEVNEITDLHGYNGTIGALWTPSRRLSVGGALDLPWTAKATQKKIVHNRVVSTSERTGKVVDEIDTTVTTVKDVEFDFPLYWAVGVLWRWTQLFYSTLDVNYTGWSDFAFQAEGDGKINPLDGSPHGQNPIDDTWAVRTGMEYLFLTRRREIPVRAGFAWEQRPALNAPDEFMSVSAGTGISFGKEPNRIFVDLAYILTWANSVHGVVPSQAALSSDVKEHQGFVSVIKHF